jgi:hypothetical protein
LPYRRLSICAAGLDLTFAYPLFRDFKQLNPLPQEVAQDPRQMKGTGMHPEAEIKNSAK